MGSVYNDDQNDWTGFGEKRVSSTRRRRDGRHFADKAAASQTDAALLLEAAAMLDRDGGVWNGPSLGSHPHRHGARGPPYPALLREGIRQARQERCFRCRSNLRSGAAPDDAVRAHKDGRAAEHSHGSSRQVAARFRWVSSDRSETLRPGERNDRSWPDADRRFWMIEGE